MFCPECGMRFVSSFEKDGEKFDVCVKGHQIKRKNHKPSIVFKKTDKESIINENGPNDEQSIIYLIPCPYCGAKKCSLIKSCTFYADEGETFFLKCLNCEKTFRNGSGDAQGS